MEKEKIGKFICELRKKKGITQKELALQLNVSDRAVSKWERGASFPDITLFEPLSKVLEVTIYDLFKGERVTENCQISKEDIEKTLEHSIHVSKSEISLNLKRYRRNYISIGIVSVCIILLLMFFQFNLSPSFEKKNENYVENMSGIRKYNGLVYEQDVLYKGKIDESDMKNYVNELKVKDGTIAKKVRFYKVFDNNLGKQNDKNLKYEIYVYINQ